MKRSDDAWRPCNVCDAKVWARASAYWAQIASGEIGDVICEPCIREIFRLAAHGVIEVALDDTPA